MRFLLAAVFYLVAAFHFSIWPFEPRQRNDLHLTSNRGPGVDIYFRYANGMEVHLDRASDMRVCGDVARSLPKTDPQPTEMNEVSNVILVVARKLRGTWLKQVIYRSGDILNTGTGEDAKLFAARQADACSIQGDVKAQANWLRVIETITQLQSAGRPAPPSPNRGNPSLTEAL